MKKLVLLAPVLAALSLGAPRAKAQSINFGLGENFFNLYYVPYAANKGNDVQTTVVATAGTGSGGFTMFSPTDLNAYAKVTGGAEAVSYQDGSTGTTIPNYGDGTPGAPPSTTATELFTFVAPGGIFKNFTFNPNGTQHSVFGTTTITYSLDGGNTFAGDPNGTGTFTIDPNSRTVEVLETENLFETSTSAILNYATSANVNLQGTNPALAVAADIIAAPPVPEPSTWAGALAGLGLLVVIHRCRRALL